MPIPSTKDEIVWRVHLATDPATVHRLLASDEGRASFWAESAEEREGGIHFVFVNGVRTVAPILRNEAPGLFELEYFGDRVRFEIAPDGEGGTDLTLVHLDPPTSGREEILAGWLNVLFPLKAQADFGIDLRTHDPERTWEQGYIDQ